MTKKALPQFVRWLKKTMKEKGWGLRETARRAGLTHSPLSYILTNGAMPSFDTCVGLAKAFDVPLESVLVGAGFLPGVDDDPTREEIIFLLKRVKNPASLRLVLSVLRSIVKEWS